MKTLSVNYKIEDYVNGRLTANDKADFEAEMMMDKDLEKEVAHQILKKIQTEQKIREHIEKVERERITSNLTHKTQKITFSASIKQKLGKLLNVLSSN